MAATPLSISGSAFFSTVRALMDMDRGMFVGSDGNIVYVCLDASFYRLEIFKRPSGARFKATAMGVPADIRVVANGQFYSPHCSGGPCPTVFQGELIVSGTVETGNPPSRPDHFHIGQWSGRGSSAFRFGVGDPSAFTSPAPLTNAMGALLPLVRSRVRVGARELRDSSGRVTQYGSPGIGSLLPRPRFFGYTAYGIHRQSQTLLVLVQREVFNWQGTNGIDLAEIIDRLMAIGVDEAVLADSGSSSMLVVDRAVEIDTNDDQRDASVPTGLMFRLQSLDIGAPATLTNTGATTDPTFQSAFTAAGATGIVSLQSPGARVIVDTLGTTNAYTTPGAFATALGITLPFTLTAPTSNLAAGASFATAVPPLTSGLPQITATLKLTSTATSDGRLTGDLTINNSRGVVKLTVDWIVSAV
jgi:hypothetical protein